MKSQIDGWISFTAPMVRATMRGDKVQTRRVIRPQPPYGSILLRPKTCTSQDGCFEFWSDHNYVTTGYKCRHKPGDTVGVKEGYQITSSQPVEHAISGYYLADGSPFDGVLLAEREWALFEKRKCPYRATPGRFMYHSLVRTRIQVRTIRVERVCEISQADALAEGMRDTSMLPKTEFMLLWDHINEKRGYGWLSNPWVWVIGYDLYE